MCQGACARLQPPWARLSLGQLQAPSLRGPTQAGSSPACSHRCDLYSVPWVPNAQGMRKTVAVLWGHPAALCTQRCPVTAEPLSPCCPGSRPPASLLWPGCYWTGLKCTASAPASCLTAGPGGACPACQLLPGAVTSAGLNLPAATR